MYFVFWNIIKRRNVKITFCRIQLNSNLDVIRISFNKFDTVRLTGINADVIGCDDDFGDFFHVRQEAIVTLSDMLNKSYRLHDIYAG